MHLDRRTFTLSVLATGVATFTGSRTAFSGNSSPKFPLSVQHAFGTTTIKTKPSRIVTFGWGGDDVLIALGIIPVAMPRYWGVPDGIFPWAREKLGDHRPTLIRHIAFDFEEIVLLKPDLILAIRTDIDRHTWRRLQKVSPTIPYKTTPRNTNWRETAVMVGEAVGDLDGAQALIGKADRYLRDLPQQYPGLKDQSFVFASFFPGANGLEIYLPGDGRVSTLLELGLRLPDGVLQIWERNPERIEMNVSLELLDTIDADLLIAWYPPGGRVAAESNPLFQRFGPVQRGAYVPLEDPVSMWIAVAPSVLSIPYGYGEFVAKLSHALESAGGRQVVQ